MTFKGPCQTKLSSDDMICKYVWVPKVLILPLNYASSGATAETGVPLSLEKLEETSLLWELMHS